MRAGPRSRASARPADHPVHRFPDRGGAARAPTGGGRTVGIAATRAGVPKLSSLPPNATAHRPNHDSPIANPASASEKKCTPRSTLVHPTATPIVSAAAASAARALGELLIARTSAAA